MGFKDIIDRFRDRKKIFKEMQDQDSAMTKLQERKLSSEERALNKILEKKRQENIKRQLNAIYKRQDNEYWHKDVITQPNIFKEKTSILKQKNLFSNRGAI